MLVDRGMSSGAQRLKIPRRRSELGSFSSLKARRFGSLNSAVVFILLGLAEMAEWHGINGITVIVVQTHFVWGVCLI